jgi:regulatory protein
MSKEPDQADPDSVARNIVLRALTASARTRDELQALLGRRNVPSDVIQRVLDRLEAVGLVDDRAYAEAFVDSRRDRSGWSRRSIQQRLRDKGVDSELIAAALDTLDADDEYATALALARKRWRQTRSLESAIRKRRLLAALGRRGYSADVARRVWQQVSADAADDDEGDSGHEVTSVGSHAR